MRFGLRYSRRLLASETRTRQSFSVRPQLESLEDRCLLSTDIVQTNLVSDVPGLAQVTNDHSVNAWGLVASPTSPFWVSNQGTGTSTLYKVTTDTSTNPPTPNVQVQGLVVNIPANPADNPPLAHGSPTGIVFNTSGTGFNVSETVNGTTKTNSSVFLFATTDGTISGWSPRVDGTNAIIGGSKSGAVYTGLAIATDSKGDTLLYAADFANNTIDVYDQNFNLVTTLPGNFTDSKLPDGYRVFNVQAIDNKLYVEYAPFDPSTGGVAAGHDAGAVDVFNADGQLQQRLIQHDHLDDPWGIAMAPANFGKFSNDLLVGNFGDGHINAFDPTNGHFVGELKGADGQPITIQHLWALQFGNGAAAGPTNTLFFTAGLTSHFGSGTGTPHGLFGSLQVVQDQDKHDQGDNHGDQGDDHGHDGNASMTPPANNPLTQQIDAIFQQFEANLLAVESNLTAMDPQLSGVFAMLNSDLAALESTILDKLDGM